MTLSTMVPGADGIERTVGVLEDAHYEPPPSEPTFFRTHAGRNFIGSRLPPGTLRHRRARATRP